MITYDQVQAILNSANGKQIEFYDASNFAQCMDLAQWYVDKLGIPWQTVSRLWARSVFEEFEKNNAPQYFDKIPNSPSFVPKKGDVGIFGKPMGQYVYQGVTYWAGHIVVCDGEGDTNYFMSYDQNWAGVLKVQRVKHNYNSFLGVLRPKNVGAAPAPQGGNMTKVDTGLNRIVHSEMEGWPYQGVHSGQFDAEFAAAWGGRDLAEMVWEKWNKNQPWRDLREAALAYYGTKADNDAKIAQVNQLTQANADLTQKLADTTKQYQDLLNKPAEPVSEEAAAQIVAEKLKPAYSFWQKIFPFLK